MTVHDSSTLAALIAAYDKSVVFEDFNIIPRHTDPLGRHAGDIERLAVV